jgi:hypothetical protein
LQVQTPKGSSETQRGDRTEREREEREREKELGNCSRNKSHMEKARVVERKSQNE